MNFGVFHHLPTGGALRVLAEWLARSEARITVYTPEPAVHQFTGMPENVEVIETPVPGPFEGIAAATAMVRADRAHRRIAAAIDARNHEAVFVLPSRLTQAPPLLRHLKTPNVYYAPEALRLAYEDPNLVFLGNDWKVRLTRAGGNPIEWLRKHIDRRAIAAARNVITHSEFTRGDLRRHYGLESKVIRLGVDTTAFHPAEPSVADDTDPYVLSIGALHPLKGHDLVIDAVAELGEGAPRLVIVGDRGDEAQNLIGRAQGSGVQLDLKRDVPFSEIVRLVQGAAVVACGQIREPFGLVPLEAMAAARPVVAVDDGGLRESVLHEETGLLVPRDVHAFSQAIARLLDDAALRARFGRRGREQVLTNWQWADYARNIDAVLLQVASESRRS